MQSLKNFLENHPIALIVSLVVTVASASIGVSEWFCSKYSTLDNRSYSLKLDSMQKELSSQIEDLKKRLVSIERKVEGQNKYIDVSSLSITSTEAASLGDDYKSFN